MHPSSQNPSKVLVLNGEAVETYTAPDREVAYAVTNLVDGQAITFQGQIGSPVANGGGVMSAYFNPVSEEKLVADTALEGLASDVRVVAKGSTDASADSSDQTSMTITRNGVDVTSDVTKPSFDGIDVTASTSEITSLDVNVEGASLKLGDKIKFDLTTATDITLEVTVSEDMMGVAAGVYVPTTYSDVDITLPAGATIYGTFTKVATTADGGALIYVSK